MNLLYSSLSRAASTLAFACSALAPEATLAGPIDAATGLEWRQLTETTNLSWNQVSTVCSLATGACQGMLGQTDFAGWTWATRVDVSAMFVNSGLRPTNGQLAADVFDAFVDSDGGADADTGLFHATHATPGLLYVQGLTRELGPTGGVAAAPYVSGTPTMGSFSVSHTAMADRANGSAYTGFWLYREAPAVGQIPEPHSLVLVSTALLGASVTRRRRASRRNKQRA